LPGTNLWNEAERRGTDGIWRSAVGELALEGQRSVRERRKRRARGGRVAV